MNTHSHHNNFEPGKDYADIPPPLSQPNMAKNRKSIAQTGRETCYFCGSEGPIETHHIVPRRLDGDDTDNNLVDLCSTCHARIEMLYTDDTWIESGLKILESVDKDSDDDVVWNDDLEDLQEKSLTPIEKAIERMSDQQLYAFYAVAITNGSTPGSAETSKSTTIYKTYENICEEFNATAQTQRSFRNHIGYLEDRSLVETNIDYHSSGGSFKRIEIVVGIHELHEHMHNNLGYDDDDISTAELRFFSAE